MVETFFDLGQTLHAYIENPEIKQFLFHQLLQNLQKSLQQLPSPKTEKSDSTRPLLLGMISHISWKSEDTATKANLISLLNDLNQDKTSQQATPEGYYADNCAAVTQLLQSDTPFYTLLTFINQVINTYPISERTRNALKHAIDDTISAFTPFYNSLQKRFKKHEQDLAYGSAQSSLNASPDSSRPGTPKPQSAPPSPRTNDSSFESLSDFEKKEKRIEIVTTAISACANRLGLDCNAYDIQAANDTFVEALQPNEPLTVEKIGSAFNALPTNKKGTHIRLKNKIIDKKSLLNTLQLNTLKTRITLQNPPSETQNEFSIIDHLEKTTDGKMTRTQARLVCDALNGNFQFLEKFISYEFNYHGIKAALKTHDNSSLSCPANLDLANEIQTAEDELLDTLLSSISDNDRLFMHHTAGIVATILDHLSSDNNLINQRTQIDGLLNIPFAVDSIRALLNQADQNTALKGLETIDSETTNKALLTSLISLAPQESPYRHQLKRDVFVMTMKLHAEHALERRKVETAALLQDKNWFGDFTTRVDEHDFSVNGILSALEQTSDLKGNLFSNSNPENNQFSMLTTVDIKYIQDCLQLVELKTKRELNLFRHLQLLALLSKPNDPKRENIELDDIPYSTKEIRRLITSLDIATESNTPLLLTLHQLTAASTQTLKTISDTLEKNQVKRMLLK